MATKRKQRRKPTNKKPSQGLGDDIAKVTEAIGIKKVVEMFTPEGKDCGCDKRREQLNKLFPKNKPNCFTKDEFDDWKMVSKTIKETNEISQENQTKIILYLRSILNMSVSGDSCKSCNSSIWKKYIDMLDKVKMTYDE